MRNILTAFGILIFGFVMAASITKCKPEPEKIPEIAPAPTKVQVIAAMPGTHRISITSHGIIEAKHKIDMLSEVSGRIISVSPSFSAGGKFKSEEPLLIVSDVSYQATLTQAQAEVAEAEQNLASERARAAQAKKEWRDLGHNDANALFLRKPQLATAEAKLAAAKALLVKAEYEFIQTKPHMYFPISIIETHVNLGQLLIHGAKVATIYASDQLQVSLPLTQAQLATLGINWPLQETDSLPEITLQAKSGGNVYQWQAQVRHSSASIDSTNQMATLLADITGDNLSAALPGLYVEATIWGVEKTDIISVPDNAFHDKRFILVAEVIADKYKVSFRQAEFLARDGNNLLLKAEVKKGEYIITDRLPLAVPGMNVEPLLQSSTPINQDPGTQQVAK